VNELKMKWVIAFCSPSYQYVMITEYKSDNYLAYPCNVAYDT